MDNNNNNNDLNLQKSDNNNFNPNNFNNNNSFIPNNNFNPNGNGTFNNPHVTPRSDYNQNYQQNYNQNYQQNYNPQYNQQPYYGGPQGPEDPGKGLAIAAMICGIAGLALTWFWGVGLVPSIVGLVLSIISGNKSGSVGLPRSGMATAGLICSAISCGLSALILISCISCIACNGGCALCTYSFSPPSYYY